MSLAQTLSHVLLVAGLSGLLGPSPAQPPRWIIWNVGQGQWVTWSDTRECWHFDMGGEFAPFRRIREECAHKRNRLFVSHWDWDHMGLIPRGRRLLTNLCLQQPPLGPAPSAAKERLMNRLPRCKTAVKVRTWTPSPGLARTANEKSHVDEIHQMLIPGDSPRTMERLYISRIGGLDKIKWLVLGHHGSRTSTSNILLGHLPHLLMAIASARKARFGHPHPQTVILLKRHRIPLLTTEEWGSIIIETKPVYKDGTRDQDLSRPARK